LPIKARATGNKPLEQSVANIISPVMHKYSIPGLAVLVYKDGQMHQYVFGVISTRSKKHVRPDTLFELGSITKSFSGLLLALQVKNGSMSLNDQITNYLDNSDHDSTSIRNITLLELATHTSGLPYVAPNLSYNANNSPKNAKTLKQFLKTWVSSYQAGTEMVYSNLGFSILNALYLAHIN